VKQYPTAAAVRTSVPVPVRLPSGSDAAAEVVSFTGLADDREHIAVRLGPSLRPGVVPLVRLHSECLTGDVFGSQRCDCGPQLAEAMQRMSGEGGWILYLRQEGRGIGLYAKLDAYALQDDGLDTFAANRALGHGDDEREYLVAAQMLQALGIDEVALLTNNPTKVEALEAHGVRVVRRVPTGVHVSASNVEYLSAKVEQHHHLIDLPARGA
jgi:GTP cyclohydrolase II